MVPLRVFHPRVARKAMQVSVLVFATALIVSMSSTSLLAAVLNVDFGAGPVYSGTRQAPDPGTAWNGINDGAAGGTFGSLVDSNNSALPFAGVSIIMAPSHNQDYNSNFGDELMNDNNYTDSNGIGSSTVTIDGLPVGALYDLYLYGDDAFAPSVFFGSLYTVTDANGSQQGTTTGSTKVFVMFAGLEADSNGQIIIDYTSNGNSRFGYVSGLQIFSVPEPSSIFTVFISILGMVGLRLRRRKSRMDRTPHGQTGV